MSEILAVTIPFFGLVLCGYLAAGYRLLPETAIPGLNGFVLFFALPCLLFRFGAGMPVGELRDPVVLGVYAVVQAAIVALAIAVTLGAHMRIKDAAFGARVAAFPNSGFMGVPLLTSLLGPAAVGAAITSLLVDMLVTTSVCIAIAMSHRDPGAPTDSGARSAVLRSLRGVATNPLRWASALSAPITNFQVLVLTLVARTAERDNVSLLAERYRADNGRVTRIIMASTVFAFFSFALLMWAPDARTVR